MIHGLSWSAPLRGIRADRLYEAAVLGLCGLRKHELEPAGLTEMEVEVRSSINHTLPVTKVRE